MKRLVLRQCSRSAMPSGDGACFQALRMPPNLKFFLVLFTLKGVDSTKKLYSQPLKGV